MAALATTLYDAKHYSGEGPSGDPRPRASPAVTGAGEELRPNRQEAARFLREAETNRRQIEKLERERTLVVQCRKNGWTDVRAELQEYENVLEEDRKAERMNLQKQLVKIHDGVRKFQRQLMDVKPTPALIERLEEVMSEVETSINTLKGEQRSRFEDLLKEERTCRQEVTAYEKKIENWSHAVKSDPRRPAAAAVGTKPPHRDLPAEVRALEAFLQDTGGLCGGWDQYDHQAFLKVWTKHSGQPAYRREAKLYLPGKTAEEIEQHEKWHQELIRLQDKKREAIQRWKASKHEEIQARVLLMHSQEEAEGREKEARSQVSQHRTEEERREMTRRLEEWREQKRRNREQEEEQRLAEETQRRRRAKEERRRQLKVKLGIKEQLRLRREEEEERRRREREEEQKEMEERRKEAAKSVRRLNERDLLRLEAKLQEKHRREREEEERRRRIAAKLKEKVDSNVGRDPSRLTRLTKGWEERMKHVRPSGAEPVSQMFHRVVPTWRQDYDELQW